MNIFNSKDKLNLFLHSKSSFDILSGVNIILSPEFYWVRKFDLPMASTKEVLSALPSLFEEFIDVTDKKFYVKKLEDKRYLCFAYDEQNIISGIKNANLSLSQINSIHFAQIELESIVDTSVQVCMKVSGVCLGFSNNILVYYFCISKFKIYHRKKFLFIKWYSGFIFFNVVYKSIYK